MFRDILEELNGVLSRAASLEQELKKEVNINIALKESLFLENQRLEEKETDLIQREEAVRKIEDIQKLKAETEALLEQTKKEMTELKTQRDAFVTYRDQENVDIEHRKAEFAGESKRVADERVALDKEKELFNKEKTEHRERVIRDLAEIERKKMEELRIR
jgi:hypothetical protein